MSDVTRGVMANERAGAERKRGLSYPCTSLVIGYGNTLRGDDAIGPCVAGAVATWQLPGVRALAVHQLTPELAEALATAGLAIFVDACPASEGEEVGLRSLEPADSPYLLGHVSDPRYLLGLARALYGWSPPAWWILVPGASFEFGDSLSVLATRGVEAAVRQIAHLVNKAEAASATHHGRDPSTSSQMTSL
jgi:hydrogenase maturation protease